MYFHLLLTISICYLFFCVEKRSANLVTNLDKFEKKFQNKFLQKKIMDFEVDKIQFYMKLCHAKNLFV